MQFMKNEPRTLCAFANPLEIDNHNKMEGTTLLEGKYWKRKLQTIRQEYSKWRNVYYSQHEDPSGNGNAHIQPTSGGGNYSVNSHGDFNNDWENYLKSPNHQFVEGTRDDVDLQSMLNEEGIIVDLLLNTFQDSTSANSELSSFLAAVFESFPESFIFFIFFLNCCFFPNLCDGGMVLTTDFLKKTKTHLIKSCLEKLVTLLLSRFKIFNI